MSPSNAIILDVSGRKYRTLKATLQVSPFFRNLLDRWDDISKQEDGSYFVDADPDVFQHILDFIRRPSKFPLFWTKEKGYDYALYNRLEAEADYFLLHDLRNWIRRKGFMEAVKTKLDIKIYSEKVHSAKYGADMEVHSHLAAYSGEKDRMNPCPHHNNVVDFQRGCNTCLELLKAHGPQYNDPEKKLTLVITNQKQCGTWVCLHYYVGVISQEGVVRGLSCDIVEIGSADTICEEEYT